MILNILRIGLIILEVVLIFNLLIIVHELGHFLAARWRGLYVDKFGVWFGKPIWKKVVNGVEFSLGWIPAGGFVLLPQMAPMESIEGKPGTARSELPSIKPLDKIIVAFAGPFFSFLLALAFATLVWAVGRPMPESETTTTIGYVTPDGPAAKAGFLPGDKILEVDGHPVSRFNGMVDSITWYVVRSEGSTIRFKVQRGDQILTLDSEFERPETTGWERKSLRQVDFYAATTPVVAKVEPGSAAAEAGLKPNDQIIAVDGQKIYYPQGITEWEQQHPGQLIPLTVLRNNERLQISLRASRPIINSVIRNSPAEVAGIRAGDRIIALNDEQIYDWGTVVKHVEQSPGQALTLTVQQGEKQLKARILPQTPDGQKQVMLGIYSSDSSNGITWDAGGRMTITHTPPLEQISAGVQTLTNTVGALLSPQSDIKLQHMSGPIMIMRTYYILFQSDFGWQLALWFSVVFNINLAVINLLPIPVLDGGHILLAILEAIRRRPLNLKLLEILQGACAILLIGFMLYVSFYDVQDLPWNSSQKPIFSSPAKAAPPENP
jgi:regulator of sigma E protease